MKKNNKNKKRVFFGYFLVLIMIPLVGIVASCGNLFEFINPPISGSDASSLVARGDQSFDNKNYTEAMEAYSNALVVSPKNAKARLGYARCIFMQFLPDFATLLALEMMNNTNTNSQTIQMILNVFNSTEGKEAIMAGGNKRYYNALIDILDSQYGIVNGEGDGQIAPSSLEVNLYLLISYASDTLLDLLDSNEDELYGSTGDLIYIDTNGELGYDVDFEGMMSNFTSIMMIDQSNAMFELYSTFEDIHDISENFLGILKFAKTKTPNFSHIIETALRPEQYIKLIQADMGSIFDFSGSDSSNTNEVNTNLSANQGELSLETLIGSYPTLYDSLKDAYTNSNSVSQFTTYLLLLDNVQYLVEDFGELMNMMHNLVAGVDAYSGSVTNFSESPWSSHSNGLKNVFETLAGVTNPYDLTNPSYLSNVFTNLIGNATNVEDIISQVTSSLNISELSNLVDIAGMFGFDVTGFLSEQGG